MQFPAKKTSHTLIFHWVAFSFDDSIQFGIVSVSLFYVTAFISIQSCINLSPRSCVDDVELDRCVNSSKDS